jgi:hypothetical protein
MEFSAPKLEYRGPRPSYLGHIISPGGPTATGRFSIFWEQVFSWYCVRHSGALYEGDGDLMTLLNKIFTTKTLVQIIFVLIAVVIMKAASLHYDFSWATALAAG